MPDDTQFAQEFLRRLGITNFDRIQEVEILISANKHSEKCEIKMRVDTEPGNMLAYRLEQYEVVRKGTKVDGVPEHTASSRVEPSMPDYDSNDADTDSGGNPFRQCGYIIGRGIICGREGRHSGEHLRV